MPDVIGALRVHLSADTAAFQTGMTKAEKQAAKSGTSIQRSMGGIKKSLGGFTAGLGALGITVGAGMFAAVGRQVLQFADDLSAAAAQVGVSVQRYQTLRESFRTLEISASQTDKILGTLQQTLGDVQSGADNSATKALDRLGVSARIMSGEIRTSDQLLDALAASAKRAGSQAQFTSDLVDIFGKKVGVDLGAALADGGKALHDLEQSFINTGLVIDENMIAKLADANEAIDRFKTLSGNQFAIWAGEAISAMERVGYWADKIGLRLARLSPFGNPETFEASIKNYEQGQARLQMNGMLRMLGFKDGLNTQEPPALRPPAPKKGKKGPKGKSAEQLERERQRQEEEALRNTQRFEADVNRSEQDIASARARLADTAIERDQFERQRLTLAYEQAVADIKNDKDLTEERRKVLLAYEDQNFALAAEEINKAENIRIEQEQANIVMDRLRLEQEILSGQADLADTQAERRRIELKILDAKYEELRHSLRQVTERNGATPDQIRDAENRIRASYGKQANETAGIRRSTMGPLESYLDSLPSTAAKADEAFEAVAAGGISSIVDGLTDAAVGARSLADVFSNVARQILADLIRIQIQKAIVGGLSSALGGGISAGAVSGLRGDVSAMIAANPGTFASGGYTGGGSTKQVAGLVHGQEYVLNAAATRRIGIPNLDALNAGRSFRAVLAPEATGSRTITVNVNAKDAVLTEQVREWVIEGVQVATKASTGYTDDTIRRLGRPRL